MIPIYSIAVMEQDTINNAGGATGDVDTLRFGAGIAASDITLARSDSNLVLGINGTSDQVRIANWGSSEQYRVERIEFAGGTTWDAANIQSQIATLAPLVGTSGADYLSAWADVNDNLQGLGGNDYLYGNNGNDTLSGGAGTDFLQGGSGNDTYLFNRDDGQDTINNYAATAGDVDTLRFGAGIAASDMTFVRNGSDLVLGINGTSGQVRIVNWGSSEQYRVDHIEFAGGTTWDAVNIQSQIATLAPLVGTSGADYRLPGQM